MTTDDMGRTGANESRESDESGRDAPRFDAVAGDAVQRALDELTQLGLQDTVTLERALLDATVHVAVWSIHQPGEAHARVVPIIAEASSGETLLALFTDESRLARYAMNLAHRGRAIPFRHVPLLVAALGFEAAVLDPGHVDSKILSAQLLARTERASLR